MIFGQIGNINVYGMYGGDSSIGGKTMIYEVLNCGKQNKKTKKELCDFFGITAENLRLAIERERREGYPILSTVESPGGYYIGSTVEEITEFIKSEKSRAKNVFRNIQPAQMQLKRMQKEAAYSSTLYEEGDQE